MNAYLAALMDKPSLNPSWCVVCGTSPVTHHHVVPRSQGGADGPQVSLCGHGTAGCHGLAEDKRLHLAYHGGWRYLLTEIPTKYETALTMEGWREV